jgi:hypothetical protein
MEIGMMWRVNNTAESLTDKIKEAADYYSNKYGSVPDTCFINPAMLKESQVEIVGISIRPYRPILPNCLWIGNEDKS